MNKNLENFYKEDSINDNDIDQYKIYVTTIMIGSKIDWWNHFGKYSFFAKTEEQSNHYLQLIQDKIDKYNNKYDRKFKIYETSQKCIYSVAAKDYKYDDQLIIKDDFNVCRAAYSCDTVADIPALDPYAPIRKYGFYDTIEEFADNLLSDLIDYKTEHPEIDECCCAAGIGGGVTTASFAPAVTGTQYPKPGKKKKKSKKEDGDETIADVYSYYGCVVHLSLSFPGSDTKVRKYYVVLGKDLGQIDEFNQKINQNIKQISNNSCILSTTLTSMLYSTEIKDFDFEGQKLLDSSLYVDDPKKFISSKKQLDQEQVQIRDIMGRSYDNLANFTNDLFTKLTEDTNSETIDDIYGFHGCVVRAEIRFDGSDTNIEKHYAVLAKNIDKIDEYNQKIKQNIKQISNNSLVTTFTPFAERLYSVVAKDFDFDGQKVLDSSLFMSNKNEFLNSEKILDQETNQNFQIIQDAFDNLSDFTEELFTKMTEDSDDTYWPVRNDETDAFENMINNARQAKKDKIIARKEKVIAKREKILSDWLEKMAQNEKISISAVDTQARKYNAATAKIKADLDRIKRLPLSSPEFF